MVERELGRRSCALVARRDNQICGVFPLSLVRSLLFGNSLVSSPLAVYGGICAADRESHDALLQAGNELGKSLGVKYVEFRNRTDPFPTTLPGKDLYVTFTQDLSPGPEQLLKGLPRDTRYAVRKSQKAGLEWTEDLDIRSFTKFTRKACTGWALRYFHAISLNPCRPNFPANAGSLASVKGRLTIAGVFCLYFRDQVLPYYGGALANFTKIPRTISCTGI